MSYDLPASNDGQMAVVVGVCAAILTTCWYVNGLAASRSKEVANNGPAVNAFYVSGPYNAGLQTGFYSNVPMRGASSKQVLENLSKDMALEFRNNGILSR